MTDLTLYHPVVEKIIDLLKTNKIEYQTFEHQPVRTSEEAAAIRTGFVLSQGAKALIVRIKKDNQKKFQMLVVPGDKRFDKQKVSKILGTKDIRFASEEEVSEVTKGVQVGGVPPFGNLFGLEVIVDPLVLENEKIIFNAGDRQFSIAITAFEYKKIVNPKITAIIA